MISLVQFLAAGLIGVITTGTGGGDDTAAYLAEGDGPKRLKEPVVLREEQGGIAGVTGTIRTVEPDGKWRLARFRRRGGKDVGTTIGTGQLSQAELTALAKSLASHDLLGMPEKLGGGEPVNPHKVILQFGKKQSTLSGVAPQFDADEPIKARIMKSAADHGVAGDPVLARFAELSHAVESSAASPKD